VDELPSPAQRLGLKMTLQPRDRARARADVPQRDRRRHIRPELVVDESEVERDIERALDVRLGPTGELNEGDDINQGFDLPTAP
jgi:hypothetical protein